MIDYNLGLLNPYDLESSFFCLDRQDPTAGFSYDSANVCGHTFPPNLAAIASQESGEQDTDSLSLRLCLGSHFARYLRHQLEEQKGYTSTVGISTNKILSKLVGSVNKPKGQTTLVPPYVPSKQGISHVCLFLDDHDIGQLPGVGFKIAQKLRQHVLKRSLAFDAGLVYVGTKENVKVRDVRLIEGIGPRVLESVLHGPGIPKDLPTRVWGLMNGVDHADVAKGREVPQQISIVSLPRTSAVEKPEPATGRQLHQTRRVARSRKRNANAGNELDQENADRPSGFQGRHSHPRRRAIRPSDPADKRRIFPVDSLR